MYERGGGSGVLYNLMCGRSKIDPSKKTTEGFPHKNFTDADVTLN